MTDDLLEFVKRMNQMQNITPNKAAAIERALIKRKITSLERRLTTHINGLQDVLGDLRQYI